MSMASAKVEEIVEGLVERIVQVRRDRDGFAVLIEEPGGENNFVVVYRDPTNREAVAIAGSIENILKAAIVPVLGELAMRLDLAEDALRTIHRYACDTETEAEVACTGIAFVCEEQLPELSPITKLSGHSDQEKSNP